MSKDQTLLSAQAAEIPLFAQLASQLTKSDAVIANYIADNLPKVLQMTISELSGETNISEVTISRFCKKLELSGFQGLKVSLATLTVPAVNDVELDVGDDTATIVNKLFTNIKSGLSMTQNMLDYEALDRAAAYIATSERILSFGYGTSGTICRDIGIRFVRFGMVSEAITDPHQQSTIAAMSDMSKTTIVVVSLSGSSVDLIEPVRIAKENGAKIILITSHKRSPLSLLADEVLVGLSSEIKLLAESSVTRLVYLAIVDILFTKVAILKNDLYKANVIKMRHALASYKS